MPTIEETLKRLAVTFTVRDIMIPATALTCARDEVEAKKVSKQNPDFSVIPLQRESKLTGYFLRDSRAAREITLTDLISDGTSILDLVEILESREFAFVLAHREIAGYVHFSDLNHHLVKLTFYVILETVERHALDPILKNDDRTFLSKNLHPKRFKHIAGQYKGDGDAARSLVNYLNIRDILRLAVSAGAIHLDDEVIEAMKSIRDGAAHASENIVSNFDSVKQLARTKRECLRILGGT